VTRQRPVVHDTFEYRPSPSTYLLLAVVVRAPRDGEAFLLSRIGQLAKASSWDGDRNTLLVALRDLTAQLSRDSLVGVIRRDFPDRASSHGISMGGLAACVSGDLCGFRMGAFRLLGPRGEELSEEIESRRPNFAAPEGVPFLGESPTRSLPFSDWAERDLISRAPGGEPLTLLYAHPFRRDSLDNALVTLGAQWLEH